MDTLTLHSNTCGNTVDTHVCVDVPGHAAPSHVDGRGYEWIEVDGRTYLSMPFDEMALAS